MLFFLLTKRRFFALIFAGLAVLAFAGQSFAVGTFKLAATSGTVNWNNGATWTYTGSPALSYPTAGDTVQSQSSDINVTLVVPSGFSTGDLSGSSGFYTTLNVYGTLSFSSSGSGVYFYAGNNSSSAVWPNNTLHVFNGGVVQVKHSNLYMYGNVVVDGGGTLAWNYSCSVNASGYHTAPTWSCVGSSGNNAIIGNTSIGSAPIINNNGVVSSFPFTYCTINNVQLNSTGETSTAFTSCTFSGMSQSPYAPYAGTLASTTNLSFTKCSWTSTSSTYALSISSSGYPTTGAYTLTQNNFDKPVQIQTPKGWTVTQNYLVSSADGTVAPLVTGATGSWYLLDSNVIYMRSNTTTGPQIVLQGTTTNNLILFDASSVNDPNVVSCTANTPDYIQTSASATIPSTAGAQTTISTNALPTQLPAGTYLQFGSVQCRVKTTAAGGATSVVVIPVTNSAGTVVASGTIASGSKTTPYVFNNNTYQGYQSGNNGALFFTATVFGTSQDCSINAQYNLVLPNIGGGAGPSVFNCTTTSSYVHVFVEHNTTCFDTYSSFNTGRSLCYLGDSGSAGVYAKTLAICRSNLGWSTNPAGAENCMIYFAGGCTANDAADPAMTGHNGSANGTASGITGGSASYPTKTGYYSGTAYMFSTTPTEINSYDVNAAVSFVDSSSNFATAYTGSWAGSGIQGHTTTGTTIGDARATVALLAANYTLIAQLQTNLRKRWAPTTSAFQNAGHDGTDIGAVQHSASPIVPKIDTQRRRRTGWNNSWNIFTKKAA